MSTSSFHDNLNHQLQSWSQELGFQSWGLSSLLTPVSLEFYRNWLEKDYQGEMQYLKRHLAEKENPRILNERLQSALVFAHSYVPHPKPHAKASETSLRKAFYAQGEDYHYWLKQKLEEVASRLRAQFPNEVFLCVTDSAPVLERDLAYRAGLGWVGKNTCLIDPEAGSFFLIGEILTSMQAKESVDLVHDFCGTCTRCLDICPTKALEAPRLLNAQKCISYLSIESRQNPALELRAGIGDWFFGCDLCQTICPWNQKTFRKTPQLQSRKLETERKRALMPSDRQNLISELRWILISSGKQLEKAFAGSALSRAGSFGLKRNAIVVAANQGLSELKPEIEAFLEHEKLRELAQWALQKIMQSPNESS